MKRNVIFLAVFIFLSTGNSVKAQTQEILKDVVAKRTMVKGMPVVSCDHSKLNKTVDVPLSLFIEELHMVKLDNSDEALVSVTPTLVTDNYILVRNKQQNPYKLFNKKGKFLTSIGAYGQGPNEYQNVYDEQLDEKSGRIYLLPWQSDKILVFDLKGQAQPHIPLKYRVPKGVFIVDGTKKTVSVFQLPFGQNSVIAWTQDFKGNVLSSIPANHLAIQPDFSNEVMSNKLAGTFDCNLFVFFQSNPDSLYHYNIAKNKLEPVFTLDFKGKPMKIHSYQELPNHYLGDVTVEKKLSENLSTTEVPTWYMVDKKTLKGSFCNIYNNYLGGKSVWPSFSNGYYVENVDPGNIIDEISKQLKENKKLTDAQRANLNRMLETMNENDNNYIFYGKLKK